MSNTTEQFSGKWLKSLGKLNKELDKTAFNVTQDVKYRMDSYLKEFVCPDNQI